MLQVAECAQVHRMTKNVFEVWLEMGGLRYGKKLKLLINGKKYKFILNSIQPLSKKDSEKNSEWVRLI